MPVLKKHPPPFEGRLPVLGDWRLTMVFQDMVLVDGRTHMLGRLASIVAKELGVSSVDEVFSDFSKEPIAAASLGQVHLGTLKKNGQKVAVKVQRAGLRELFATDLKNLRKLCELLDSVDPKSDGADRSYIDVFDESEKLLYEEIDYLNEAKNADRFREQFKDDPQVRVPEMIYEY